MRRIFINLCIYLIVSSSLYAGGNIIEDTNTMPSYTVGFKVGTLGAGVDISTPLRHDLYLRLNINGAKLNIDDTDEGIIYDTTVDLFTAGVLLDYYPFADETLHITGGAYYYANKAKADGVPTAPRYDVGNNTYTKEQIGTLSGSVEFLKFAPYIGFGYGGRSSATGWSFAIDVGLMYHGDGDLSLDINRGTISDADFLQLQNDIEIERIDMQNDVRDMPFYPVLMVGATYNF